MEGEMRDITGALKTDGAGVGNQQTNKTHGRRGLGPGGQLEG